MSETNPTPPATPSPKPEVPRLPDKKEERPDFRVIRSAPPPPSGPGVMPFVFLALVVVLGVGGWLLTRGADPDNGGKTTTSTAPVVPPRPLPDYVREVLEFKINEGNLESALAYAQEKKVELELTNCPDLDSRISWLRKELNVEELSPEEALRSASQKVEAKQWAEALDTLGLLLGDESSLTPAQEAQARYLAAEAYANTEDRLEAKSQLEAAKQLGFDAAKCRALEQKYDL